jgi:DNA (cytosine-5)-methyltransferase 1
MKIEAVDLFCGVGGLTHGVINAGIKVLAGIDIDPTCQFAYQTNNNAEFIRADVGNYDSNKIKAMYSNDAIKVLMGCAPCQPFAKLQKGEVDKTKNYRWEILHSFLSHIKKSFPK